MSLRGRVATALIELERHQSAAQERAAEVERDRTLLESWRTFEVASMNTGRSRPMQNMPRHSAPWHRPGPARPQ